MRRRSRSWGAPCRRRAAAVSELRSAFLHDADILFLDEPTSNIDSLNEGMILRSLKEECADKTILMVSHRKSTMGIADDVLEM